MKHFTIIKGHTSENNYDGYDAHRHWEVLKMSVADYLSQVVAQGLVFPGTNMVDFIMSPWEIPWIRDNVVTVGYGYKELVEPKYYHLYAFDNYHDGVDGQPIEGGPGTFIQQVQSSYVKTNGLHATADIYELTIEERSDNMPDNNSLTPEQIQAGTDAVNALNSVGIVANPENYMLTFDKPVPQWLFWVIMERIRVASIVKQGKDAK